MKEIKNKTVLLVTGLVVVLLIIALFLTQCGEKESNKEKGQTGSKEPGKEVIIDEKEDETGLEVGTPEEADKEDKSNAVEFVKPDTENSTGAGSNADNKGNTSSTDSAGESANTEDKTEGDKTEEDKTEDKNTGNLDEEDDSTGQYGEFF